MSETRSDIPTAVPGRRRIPWLALGLAGAGAALIGGLAWTLVTLGDPASPQPAGTETGQGMAIRGHHRPAEYALPTYPTAFEFNSLVVNRGAGSVAYSLKGGTALQVAAFYRDHLAKAGWRLESEIPTSQKPGEGKEAQTAEGWQQLWTKPAQSRRLILLALDLRHGPSTGQVVLSWSPLAR